MTSEILEIENFMKEGKIEIMNMQDTNTEMLPENPIYWESATIRENDNAIVIDINGSQKRVCRPVNPSYETVLSQLRKTYPELKPGSTCKFFHYRDGRTEIVTSG